jgi:hypothetical protein
MHLLSRFTPALTHLHTPPHTHTHTTNADQDQRNATSAAAKSLESGAVPVGGKGVRIYAANGSVTQHGLTRPCTSTTLCLAGLRTPEKRTRSGARTHAKAASGAAGGRRALCGMDVAGLQHTAHKMNFGRHPPTLPHTTMQADTHRCGQTSSTSACEDTTYIRQAGGRTSFQL